MQDKYLPIRSAGLLSLGTLQTGSFPSSHWSEALLTIQHTSITMLFATFRCGMLPME